MKTAIKWNVVRDSRTNKIVSYETQHNNRTFIISRRDVIGEGIVIVLNDYYTFNTVKSAKEFVANTKVIGA